MVVMSASPRSNQLRLLRWKPRQSAANRKSISNRSSIVTAVSDPSLASCQLKTVSRALHVRRTDYSQSPNTRAGASGGLDD